MVLRQRWALKFLEIDYRAFNVINVDETWLGMMDFRRRHWTTKEIPSIEVKNNSPRISMIVGVDKFGEIYLSLT